MSFNSLKKTIKYRVSYSGTKETDILYKRYFINQLEKFSEKDLEDIKSLFNQFSDNEIYDFITSKSAKISINEFLCLFWPKYSPNTEKMSPFSTVSDIFITETKKTIQMYTPVSPVIFSSIVSFPSKNVVDGTIE